jgi:hypothetical protein
MRFAKRMLMVAGAGALAGILAIALAPKAAHALVATLVQVANTTANPVPNKDVDNPDRATAVDQFCIVTGTAGSPGFECDTTAFFTVPAGQRLVLEQLEAACTTPEGNSLYGGDIEFSEGGNSTLHPFALGSPATHAGVTSYVLNQQVRYYVDAGSPIFFQLGSTDTSGSTNCTFQFNGHLISYP